MSTKINLQKIKNLINSLLFPDRCLVCEGWLTPSEMGICQECNAELVEYHSFISCDICGRTMHPELAPICPDCLVEKPSFVSNCSAVEYNSVGLELVHAVKYRYFYRGGLTIGSIMDSSLPQYENITVVPVPLSKIRLKERGFNQAELIAQRFAFLRGLKMEPVLERARHTVAQASLSRIKRKLNVKGAFRLKKGYNVIGQDFLLIDDVFTTGSTVNECAFELVKAGARNIFVASFMAA